MNCVERHWWMWFGATWECIGFTVWRDQVHRPLLEKCRAMRGAS